MNNLHVTYMIVIFVSQNLTSFENIKSIIYQERCPNLGRLKKAEEPSKKTQPFTLHYQRYAFKKIDNWYSYYKKLFT